MYYYFSILYPHLTARHVYPLQSNFLHDRYFFSISPKENGNLLSVTAQKRY